MNHDGTLESLRAMLEALPPKQAETAQICWDDIKGDALLYREALSTEAPKRKVAPWEVQRDLDGLAASMRDLESRLRRVPPDVLRVIENKANFYPPELTDASRDERLRYQFENPKTADPFPWFRIGRYSPQRDGTWEAEETHWGHDATRPHDLATVAAFLEELAGEVAAGKAPPNGRRESKAGNQSTWGKEWMIASLDFELHWIGDRPKSHVLPIIQVIHQWATGDPVGDEWGLTELVRHRKRMAEGIRRQEEEGEGGEYRR